MNSVNYMCIISLTAVHDIIIQQCVDIDASHALVSLCRPVDHIRRIQQRKTLRTQVHYYEHLLKCKEIYSYIKLILVYKRQGLLSYCSNTK